MVKKIKFTYILLFLILVVNVALSDYTGPFGDSKYPITIFLFLVAIFIGSQEESETPPDWQCWLTSISIVFLGISTAAKLSNYSKNYSSQYSDWLFSIIVLFGITFIFGRFIIMLFNKDK